MIILRSGKPFAAAAAVYALAMAGGVTAVPEAPSRRARWPSPSGPRMSPGDITVGGWPQEKPWASRRTVLRHARRPVLTLSPADQERLRLAQMKRARKAEKARRAAGWTEQDAAEMLALIRGDPHGTGRLRIRRAAEDAVAFYPGSFSVHGFNRRPDLIERLSGGPLTAVTS